MFLFLFVLVILELLHLQSVARQSQLVIVQFENQISLLNQAVFLQILFEILDSFQMGLQCF